MVIQKYKNSTGPSAPSAMFQLYRKTEKMEGGRNVYVQVNDYSLDEGILHSKLLIDDNGVWMITYAGLRAATPSESPTSVKWQYYDKDKDTWLDDPALTVTSLSDKPDDCECEPRVEGVYKADGSYFLGRPVLQHEGGPFSFSVYSGSRIL